MKAMRAALALALLQVAASAFAEEPEQPAPENSKADCRNVDARAAVSKIPAACELVTPDESGAVLTLALSVSTAKSDAGAAQDALTAFERAATAESYLGALKLPDAASCAATPSELLWGWDLAECDELASDQAIPLFTVGDPESEEIPVRSAESFLDAGQKLFGIITQKRFPPQAGRAALPEGAKASANGPCQIWAAVAVAVAGDKRLAFASCGSCPPFKNDRARMAHFERLLKNLASNALKATKEAGLSCKDIYVGYRETWVPEGNAGSALAALPSVALPKEALPSGDARKLAALKMSEWEKNRKLAPLPSREE